MKAEEVIIQLYKELPKNTDLFSNPISITSLTQVGGTATAVTASAHGLTTGDTVTITGAETDTPLNSLTRVDTTLTAISSLDHDLTYNPRVDVDQFVTIEGAAEAEFNGEFKVTRVVNRQEFELLTEDSGATTATGSPVGIDILQNDYNGLVAVTVIDTTTFEYSVDSGLPTPAGGAPVVHAGVRVTGVVTADRIVDIYSEQPPTDLWAFVVLNDVIASKDRNITNDSTATQVAETFRIQKLIQGFSVFVVAPADTELAAREARDLMEDVAGFLYSSLIGFCFNTGFFSDKKWVTTSLGHSFQLYNTSYYIHEFVFEQLANILIEDSIGRPDDAAFRDIDLTLTPSTGVEPMIATINLDEEPL